MKIVFISPYPVEGPSSRYRIEQFVPHFKNAGIDCIVRPFMSSKFYKILYCKKFTIAKLLFFFQSSLKRAGDFFTALRGDIVFIHLESFPFGPALFENLLYVCGKKIIYDFDDAIFLGRTSPAHAFLNFLKCPSKVRRIVSMSSHVVTGNEYLASFARHYNRRVTVIQTCVDTDKFTPLKQAVHAPIVIGWIGTHSTAAYLESLKEVFCRLAEKYAFQLRVIGSGKDRFDFPGVNVRTCPWSLNTEIQEFQSLDIGVYPLPRDEWAHGKAGFKAIQYMSVGVACVASAVGANNDIITHGHDGLLVNTPQEWIQQLGNLIDDPALRARIGNNGRQTIVKHYALSKTVPKYITIFNQVYTKRRQACAASAV